MGNKDQSAANAVAGWMSQQSTPASVTSAKWVLGTTAPTPTSNMTQLTGTGSTPVALPWTSPSGGAISNSSAVSNTNGSGSSWTITGVEEWNAALAVRYMEGAPTGVSVGVANGNVLQWPIGSITWTEQ
jgi:hypothetical protein